MSTHAAQAALQDPDLRRTLEEAEASLRRAVHALEPHARNLDGARPDDLHFQVRILRSALTELGAILRPSHA